MIGVNSLLTVIAIAVYLTQSILHHGPKMQ